MEVIFRARYVFPVDRPPIENGFIAVEHDRIAAIGSFEGQTAANDLGNVAVIPGLVNAHSHLEFSHLAEPLGHSRMSLPQWIREIVRSRKETAEREEALPANIAFDRQAIRMGQDESARYGVTAVGDISTHADICLESYLHLADFLELRAFRKRDVPPCLSLATKFCQALGFGLSPHAPYTVHADLLDGVIDLALNWQKPIAMHLGESREEIDFLRTSQGPFRELLEERGWWEAGAVRLGSRTGDYLEALSRVAHSLVIHGNYLDENEIHFVGSNRDRMSIVYCPRTHAYFGHETYPLAKMLSAGVRVALGTDSRASNPDLDLRQEMQFVIDKHGLSPEQALRMGTIEGAAALNLGYGCGTITKGKYADLTVIQLPSRRASDPHELLFDPEARVAGTICRGRVVFSQHPAIAAG